MAVTHNMYWTVERGEESIDVCIDYTYSAGAPAHFGSLTYPGHPADPDEVEIQSVWRASDENLPDAPEFELTDEEREKIEQWICENPPEPDYPDDYD
jgi:hypothetical protein